jgi:hypothetical protein
MINTFSNTTLSLISKYYKKNESKAISLSAEPFGK